MDGGIWGYHSPQHSLSGRELPGHEPSRGDEGGKRADENTLTTKCNEMSRPARRIRIDEAAPASNARTVRVDIAMSSGGNVGSAAPAHSPVRRAVAAGATAVQVAGESTACAMHRCRPSA